MSQKNLRKLIQNKREFNPFNDAFNFEKLEKLIGDNSNKFDVSLVKSTQVFNLYYKGLYKYLRQLIESQSVSIETIMKYFIGIANRDYMLMRSQLSGSSKNEMHFEDISSFKISSPNSHIGEMNLVAAVETVVEILNILINYLKYFADRNVGNNVEKEEFLKEIGNTYRFTNIYYMMKNTYDTAVWEEGYIEEEEGKLHMRYIDKDYPIHIKIGNFRHINNIFSFLNVQEELLSNSYRENAGEFRKFLMRNRKPVSLEEVTINAKGNISYRLSTKKNSINISQYIKHGNASIAAYYPHLEDLNLPELDNLTINDLLILLSQLNDLVGKVSETKFDLTEPNFKELAFKIKRKDLIKYLTQTTFYSNKNIVTFLSLIESDGLSNKRIELWKRPLIRYRDTYYICLSSISAPNYLYLIDEWLEYGGYGIELKKRGKLFEKYMKLQTIKKLQNKQLPFKVPQIDKFYNDNDEYEEIDLIISFENLLIVGELKNIKFPMEPRDYHNALKRLYEGASQAKRKADFLLENKDCFIDELGDIMLKKICPVVITNFSIFSGLELNGVPVIDPILLESYLGSGEFTRLKLEIQNGETETTVQDKVKYYKNVEEFISNFPSYLEAPFPIQDLKKITYVDDHVISLKKAKPQVYIEIADFKIR